MTKISIKLALALKREFFSDNLHSNLDRKDIYLQALGLKREFLKDNLRSNLDDKDLYLIGDRIKKRIF